MFDELSTNRHSLPAPPQLQSTKIKSLSHPDFSFPDANLALLCGSDCFLVHHGVLARHSRPLAHAIENAKSKIGNLVQLHLNENPSDILYFLHALYDGIYGIKYDPEAFKRISSILRMATKYQVPHLREELLQGLTVTWPPTLREWDMREALATDTEGVYAPRKHFPHPVLIISLARQINAPELLAAAFYDISRCTPNEIARGYINPQTQTSHHLTQQDLLNALRGREHGSRFLSTFIVNELEGRKLATTCLFRNDPDPPRRRICQTAFENITFEILRDVNGVVCQRSVDPLFAILDAELMQSKERTDSVAFRTCEVCRTEFSLAVTQARSNLWLKLKEWFAVDSSS